MHTVTTAGRRLHALLQQHGPLCRGGAAAAATFLALTGGGGGGGSDRSSGSDARRQQAKTPPKPPKPPLLERLRAAGLGLAASAAVGAAVAVATRGSAADVARRAALRRVAAHAGLAELLGAPVLLARATTAAVATGGGARARLLDLGGGLALPVPWLSERRARLAFEVTGSGGAAGGRGGAAAGALVAADAFLSPWLGRARFRRLYVDVPCESASADARAGGVGQLYVEAREAVCARELEQRRGLAGLLPSRDEAGGDAAAEEEEKEQVHVEPGFARITLVGTPVPTTTSGARGGGGDPVRDALRLALRAAARRDEAEAGAGAGAGAGAAAGVSPLGAQDEAERLPELEVVRVAREAAGRALGLGASLVARARDAVGQGMAKRGGGGAAGSGGAAAEAQAPAPATKATASARHGGSAS
jgi:hypothetical protein